MGQALYRSHRPKKLDDVVGQEHITTTLAHALKKGTISHAYLFTGPRGTGKTTIARILAHEINGLPYEDDSMHLDIIEIDAASNRRIDEIRDLRDKVNLAPTSAKFKVYIIDEVHMLTREAFNALLKTLEEPPAHVVFMLATTEMHKLPETIVSRTQHFALKPVELAKVVAHLRSIAEQEKIKIDDDALALIAEHGEGSFRDSISLLDQLRNASNSVTLADVQAVLGIAPAETIQTLLSSVQQCDVVSASAQLTALQEQGYEPARVAKQLGTALRTALVSRRPTLSADVTLRLLAQLVEVPASTDPRTALEIAVFDAMFAGAPQHTTATTSVAKPQAAEPKTVPAAVQAKPASISESHPSSFSKKLAAAEVSAEEATKPAAPDEAKAHETSATVAADTPDDDSVSDEIVTTETWATALAAIKKQFSTLYGIAQAAQAAFEPGKIILTSAFAFHQKRLNEPRNREILARAVETAAGQKIRIECVVGEAKHGTEPAAPPLPPETAETVHEVATPPASPTEPTTPTSNDPVAAVSNIFGGAELLQS